MWLLNAETYELKSFFESKLPDYATLSHTWGDGEVTFKNMLESRYHDLEGFKKIKLCCSQALRDGLAWVWIDTCCIDKSSSAELSEAINSMYRWYKQSEVCYAYLSDIDTLSANETKESLDESQFLTKSRWFTRGWTFQELLAPSEVAFYDGAWSFIGYKSTLAKMMARATNIPEKALRKFEPQEWRVCSKMAWYGHRETTRIEDCAYSLLGIFDVNMPLLYGEGEKAFERLQELIFETTKDMTIFSWDDGKIGNSGLLAPLPSSFARCQNRTFGEHTRDLLDRFKESCTASLTKTGFELSTELHPYGLNVFLLHVSNYRIVRHVPWSPLGCLQHMQEYMYIQQVNRKTFRRIRIRNGLLMTRRDFQCHLIGFSLFSGYKFDISLLRTGVPRLPPLAPLKPFPHVSVMEADMVVSNINFATGIFHIHKGLRRTFPVTRSHLGVKEHFVSRNTSEEYEYDCLFVPGFMDPHAVKIIFLLQKPVILECGREIFENGFYTAYNCWADANTSSLSFNSSSRLARFRPRLWEKYLDLWHVYRQSSDSLSAVRSAIEKALGDEDHIAEAPLCTIRETFFNHYLHIHVNADFIVCERGSTSNENGFRKTIDRWIYMGYSLMENPRHYTIEE